MPIIQNIDTALEKNVGPHGVSDAALSGALARAEGALDRLRRHYTEGTLPLLRLPEKTDDLAEITSAARSWRQARATSSSSAPAARRSAARRSRNWPASTCRASAPLRDPPRIHFIDNLDALSFATMLERLPLKTSRFVAISKSGGTAETLMQTIAALSALKKAGADLPKAMLGISEPAKAGQAQRPARSADAARRRAARPRSQCRRPLFGADQCRPVAGGGARPRHRRHPPRRRPSRWRRCSPRKTPAEVPAALGAALAVALAETKGKSISVLMAYADRLERFTHWYVQLWAESLGKNGKGTTPLAALGPVDQHSQVQLFIAGPRDKLFNVVTVGGKGLGPRIDGELATMAGEPGFAGKTIGDLVAAEGRATAETLAKNGCPVRGFHIETLDEAALGELMMHFMLETIVAAHLMGIDAFDQPAVEEGKVLAKKYLLGT